MKQIKVGVWGLSLAIVLASAGSVLAAAAAVEAPKVILTDGTFPLWELRPLDRLVYVVSLDGTWKRPAVVGASYQLCVRFPDGTVYSHRPINDDLFERGEMRFMLPEYLLLRTKVAKGGKINLYVTERPTAGAKRETISNTLELTWPLKRPVARRAPATKFTPAPPIDNFPDLDARPAKKE